MHVHTALYRCVDVPLPVTFSREIRELAWVPKVLRSSKVPN